MYTNLFQQARKPRSYASSKLRLTHSLTGVKCRATSVAKKQDIGQGNGNRLDAIQSGTEMFHLLPQPGCLLLLAVQQLEMGVKRSYTSSYDFKK